MSSMILLVYVFFSCFIGTFSKASNEELKFLQSQRLIDDPVCRDDLKKICGEVKTNFAVLECVQDKERDDTLLSKECHHLLWNYKLNFTKSSYVEELAKNVCDSDLETLKICKNETHPGLGISCMTEHLDNIKSERCYQYIVRMGAIVFSDYRLTGDMMEKCRPDITKLNCGRIQSLNDDSPHTQGSTIECLMKTPKQLSLLCQEEIFRLAELQSIDFHLDRAFYFSCLEAREKFCQNIRAGDGRVYKCLMKHKNDRGMNPECVENLRRRQKLTLQDYKVSHSFIKTCASYIQKYNCRRGVMRSSQTIKLAQILLCLEGELRNGQIIDNACQGEMLSHRRMILDDYELSPDLVASCQKEVKEYCGGELQTGGKTLHCLMKYSKRHKKRIFFSDTCLRSLEEILHETDVGEDWRADPVLYESCHSFVDLHCKGIRGGQARVIKCLMNNLGTIDMPSACEAALLEIQYFVARDWKLDPQLYKACHNESLNMCHAQSGWINNVEDTADSGILVLPCLFRYAYHPDPTLKLSSQCTEEVQRIMHERAAYVDLHPEIESVCMGDLARFCTSHTGPGEEIACLQDNLERLESSCHVVIKNYTEAEAKDAGLNALLMQHCTTVILEVCEGMEKESSEEGDLMDCLIQHKNAPAMRNYPKCRVVIESFQLVSQKDILFSPKFKKECESDVSRYCSTAKTKVDVIECLSSLVRDQILSETRHKISRGCRQQLRNQLTQRLETPKLDPKLMKVCRKDIEQLCADEPMERGLVLECLRNNEKYLGKKCHRIIFLRKQEEMTDPSTDIVLVSSCRDMIKTYCHDSDFSNILSCLKLKRNEKDFAPQCHSVIIQRMIEQSEDYRLNPTLYKSCFADMRQHCASILFASSNETEMNGLLIDCLKKKLMTAGLSGMCSTQVMVLVRDAALYFKMDPVLKLKCNDEIKQLCDEEIADKNEDGSVMECLKQNLEEHNIKNEECQKQIAFVIQTQKADIFLDPVLHKICSVDDAKFCYDKEQGTHLTCLFDLLDRRPLTLEERCRKQLQSRRLMYQSAMQISRLDNIGDLVQHVKSSPSRNYILLVFVTVIGVIFIGGLFCGRATKRYKLLKDR